MSIDVSIIIFFSNNEYQALSDSINNGNCYSRDFINRINWIDKSIGEDNHITFHQNANIFTGNTGKYSMAYRWGWVFTTLVEWEINPIMRYIK